jgi:Ca-activated chloride channel family protein
VSFSRPELLGFAFVAPILAALGVWAYGQRRRAVAQALADRELIGRLGAADLLRFPRIRLVLIAGAAGLLALAAAGPRWGTRVVEGVSSSRSVVLALDVSKSMLAEDTRPNRLERERLFVRRLMREMQGDRLGLVAFAGRAYVLSPLTVDHGALNLYVDAIDPDIVSQGGSSLASALIQAVDLARGAAETAADRAVVLISDGEALEDVSAVQTAADRAARAGVRVFTIGVGTAAGARVPELDAVGTRIGYKVDENGETVVSRLDDGLLKQIADRTGGAYYALDDASSTARLMSALGGVARTDSESGRRVEPRERHAGLIALALLLLLIDSLIEYSRGRPPAGLRALRMNRAARTAALIPLFLLTSAAGPGDIERGNRHYRAGRYAEAVEAYQSALRGGSDTSELRYNLGTALLQLGRYDEAEQHFTAALDAVDPDLRERTFYNLGNRFLEGARNSADPASQGPLLGSAIEAYQRALRIDPRDLDAKWNLEMAIRDEMQNEQPSQSGDEQQEGEPDEQQQEGQGGGSPQDAEQQEEPSQSASDRMPLTQEQADRVLSAVEQDERDLTREKLRKGQRRTPVRRDW